MWPVTTRASTYAPYALSAKPRSVARPCSVMALAPASHAGNSGKATPRRFSLYASGRCPGAKIGASNRCSGWCTSAWQSQSRIQALSSGSPSSDTPVDSRIASGQVK